MQLSKTDYMLFLRHPAWLWLRKHDSGKLPLPDDALQARFDAGHDFEEYANKLFPGLVTLGFNIKVYGDYNALLSKTKKTLESGAKTIAQARFLANDLTCIIDVIDRVNDNEFDLYEIKSSAKVKPEYIDDLAFQKILLELSGLKVRKVFVIYVNNQYVRKGDIDFRELTKTEEVTDKVNDKIPETKLSIQGALNVMHSKTCPDMSPRYQKLGQLKEWMAVYKFIYADTHPHSIYNLTGLKTKLIGELEDLGIRLIKDIPESVKLTAKQLRQVQATKLNQRLINAEKIKEFLETFEYPLYFFDYETFFNLIPPFDGISPFKQIPFQYSLHILESPGAKLEHKEYLHTKCFSHPGLPLLQQLKKDIGNKGSVLVWHESFEKGRNLTLGELFPEYSGFMEALNERIIDLKIPVSEGWIVDKDFFGSASIKSVLPVLISELSYEKLEIHEGSTASLIWVKTILEGKNPEKKDKIIKNLLEYCCLDTLAMVKLLEFLQSEV